MTDETTKLDMTDKSVDEVHAKIVDETRRIIDESKPGDRVALMVDSEGTMAFATNTGGAGAMSMIEVLTMQIGRLVLEENEGRTDVPYHEAFLYGSMHVAKASMERAKQMQEAAEKGEEGAGKHYRDDVTDDVAGGDGAGNVH